MKNIRPFKLNLTSRQLILSTSLLLTVDSFLGYAGASPVDQEIPIAAQYPHAEAFFFTAQSQQPEYQCEGKIYCSQMTSCEEATFYLRNCPNVKIDGDGDGIPCESQWCHS